MIFSCVRGKSPPERLFRQWGQPLCRNTPLPPLSLVIQALVLSLNGGDEDGVDDIGDRRAPAQIIDGLVESLEKRPDGDGAGGALDGFISDISGIEGREDEDIGLSGDGASGEFGTGDAGIHSGVVLNRSFDEEFRSGLASLGRCFAHGIDVRAGPRRPGGVAQHGDFGIKAKGARRGGRRDGDVGELIRGGVGDDGAVAVEVDAIGQAHEENAGNRFDARFGLDELKCGADCVGRGRGGAGHHAVRASFIDHHGAKESFVGHECSGFFFGHSLGFTQFIKGVGIVIKTCVVLRIDDLDTIDVEVKFVGLGGDVVFFAEENDVDEFLFFEFGGGAQNAVDVAFGQDDGLFLGTGNGVQASHEFSRGDGVAARFDDVEVNFCALGLDHGDIFVGQPPNDFAGASGSDDVEGEALLSELLDGEFDGLDRLIVGFVFGADGRNEHGVEVSSDSGVEFIRHADGAVLINRQCDEHIGVLSRRFGVVAQGVEKLRFLSLSNAFGGILTRDGVFTGIGDGVPDGGFMSLRLEGVGKFLREGRGAGFATQEHDGFHNETHSK